MADLQLAQMQNRQLQVEQIGSKATIPSNPIGRLMYYLHCMTDVLGNCIPSHLTNFQNCSSLSSHSRDQVVEIAKEYPPSKIPAFIEVDELPDNSGNEFLRLNALEETVTALGIPDAGVMALRRQLERQQLLEVMAYTAGWAQNNYYGPLREIQRQKEMQQRRQWEMQQQQLEWQRERKSKACAIL